MILQKIWSICDLFKKVAMPITTLNVYPEILTVTGDLVDVCGQAYESAANIPVKLKIAFTMMQN